LARRYDPGMNLASVLLARAGSEPGAVALHTEMGTISYGELDQRSAALAGVLGQRTERATRIGLVAGNTPAFVVAYLAALRAGMIAVPLDPTGPARELGRNLTTVGAGLVVASETHRAHGGFKGAGLEGTVVVVLAADGTFDGAAAPAPDIAPVDAADPAVLLFTSGTAGAPKPAILTHGSLGANLDQVHRHPGLALRPDDVGLGLLPFFHIFGLNVVLGLTLSAGASVALIERFDPAGSVARVRDAGVTVIAGVPAVFSAWLDLPEERAPRDAFARVRMAVSGAAALPVETAAAMHERFGVDVREGYGLTEASPIVTTAAVGGVARPGSIGPPLPGVEVRLVEVDGGGSGATDVLVGDPGEIWARGDNVFAGYWKDPEATERVLDADGWLHTGDLAILDDDGWLRLVDRAKDLIIVSGFNVYPAEVEDALVEHPDVAEAAVVGVADARSGEAVVAFVVPCEGANPTWTELTAHLRRRLARYKIPARIDFVAELPHNFAGKVPRRALRALAGRGTEDATANPA
jgi:long-chain acyl-CoA synthetase